MKFWFSLKLFFLDMFRLFNCYSLSSVFILRFYKMDLIIYYIIFHKHKCLFYKCLMYIYTFFCLIPANLKRFREESESKKYSSELFKNELNKFILCDVLLSIKIFNYSCDTLTSTTTGISTTILCFVIF